MVTAAPRYSGVFAVRSTFDWWRPLCAHSVRYYPGERLRKNLPIVLEQPPLLPLRRSTYCSRIDAREFLSRIAMAKGLAAKLRSRQPAMIGTPSARQILPMRLNVSDFARLHAEPLDNDVCQRIIDLGIVRDQSGCRNHVWCPRNSSKEK
jgi:hypothetical protein